MLLDVIWWAWIVAVAAFLFYLAKSLLPTQGKFPGVESLLDAGPVHIDWTGIVALALVGLLAIVVLTHQIPARDAAVILAGALAGKAVGKQ